MALLYKDGNPVKLHIGDRYYMVCDETCYDVDGTELHEHCGALVDVTDKPMIRMATDNCGITSNHVSTYNGRTG